jgi:ATP-binding cassette subfamily A (ABC1) protein 3
LKAATGNKDFKFKVVNSPFPVTAKLRNREAARNGTFIVFVIAIGFSLIPASIISFIINEKEKNLRHMQLISGMKLSSFWISNYIFDIIKAEIPMGIVIGLMYAYSLDY